MLEQTHVTNATIPQTDRPRIRHLPFSGTRNFRDLGGYETTDGRTVRWGVLYRSDALHRLTQSGLRHLASLRLHRVVDFRSQREREQEPDKLPGELVSRVVGIPILDHSTESVQESRDEFVKKLKQLDSARSMIVTNVELVRRFTPEFKQFIHLLLSSNGHPILFHCAAGKDRTGFAAAILLRILGAPPHVVMDDYLLTNRYFLSRFRWSLMILRWIRGRQFFEAVRGFMIADATYLNAAFEAIDIQYGSFENYVRDGLGITSEAGDQLKSLYLE